MKSPIDYLENLQNKPEAVRRAFAVASVFVIMSVIVSVWFANFSISDSDKSMASVAGSVENQPSPFTLLWNYSKEAIGEIKGKITETEAVVTEIEKEVSALQENVATSTDSLATSTESEQE